MSNPSLSLSLSLNPISLFFFVCLSLLSLASHFPPALLLLLCFLSFLFFSSSLSFFSEYFRKLSRPVHALVLLLFFRLACQLIFKSKQTVRGFTFFSVLFDFCSKLFCKNVYNRICGADRGKQPGPPGHPDPDTSPAGHPREQEGR
jgi:hypothetical protein